MVDERLTEADRLGRVLFDDGPIGVFTYGPDGQVLRANPAMVRLLGSPDEATTRLFNVYTLPTIPERLREDIFRACIERGEVREVEFEYISMHGVRRFVRLTATPVKEGGQTVGAICHAEDLSAWRHLSEQLRLSSKMESLSLLAGSFSHDLNNIFTTLLGFTSLLSQEREMKPERQQRALGHIRSAAQSGAKLVEQLLNFTSERQAEAAACSFSGAWEQALTLFQYGLPSRITVETKDETGGELWVSGSRTKLEQVLLNVALNAKDALGSEPGSITFTASRVEAPPGDAVPAALASRWGFVCASISDSGSGISAEVLPRIFDPYFTTKEKGRGTGLGLSSVWGIMRELGGSLRVESALGKGSRFDLYFPVQPEQRETPADRAPVVHTLSGRGERVVVVEPDPELRELLVWLLLKNNYKALTEETSEGTLRMLESAGETAHALVWDLTAGGPALERMQELRMRHRIPLLLLSNTGRAMPPSVEGLVLPKPFSPPQFLQALATLLAPAGPGDAPDDEPA